MNVIFGVRSNLSRELINVLDDAIALSASDANELSKYKNERINIVINSFQKSTKKNNLQNPKEYIEKTLYDLSIIINTITEIKDSIGVVIYTSSASVYGDNGFCSEEDQVYPSSIYSSLKISSEIMVEKYLSFHNIQFIISRVFNIYGGIDNFSVISKIIDSYDNSLKLDLINEGFALRDYIHVHDVSLIYQQLLNTNYCGVINIATGKALSVNSIIDALKKNSIELRVNNLVSNEINKSVASIRRLESIIKLPKFINVNEYILNKIKLN